MVVFKYPLIMLIKLLITCRDLKNRLLRSMRKTNSAINECSENIVQIMIVTTENKLGMCELYNFLRELCNLLFRNLKYFYQAGIFTCKN